MKSIGKGREYNKNERNNNNLRAIWGGEEGEFLRVKNVLFLFPAKLQVL